MHLQSFFSQLWVHNWLKITEEVKNVLHIGKIPSSQNLAQEVFVLLSSLGQY